jgi:hypothetical protein
MRTLRDAMAAVNSERPSGSEAAFARFRLKTLKEPERVVVDLDVPQARFLGREPGKHAVWLMVKDDPQSVFFDPASGEFGACWGPDATTGEYQDLGARSDGAFEMYVL